MAAKKRRKRAKKSRKKGTAKRSKKRGGKIPLVVLEHLAAGAVAAVKRRKGTVREHTKAEMKRARK
jgi:hypothetical protein